MRPGFLIGLIVVFVIGFLPPVSSGEDVAAPKKSTVFTNQDIEKYKTPSDNKPSYTKPDRTTEKKEKARAIMDEKEKEYWCNRGNQPRRKIERIKEDIAEAEKNLSGETGGKVTLKKKKEFTKSIEISKKKLKYAEKDLAEVEDEAHRKGIPPGWLRCQFE